jgi:hypothetical protein
MREYQPGLQLIKMALEAKEKTLVSDKLEGKSLYYIYRSDSKTRCSASGGCLFYG